MGEEPIAEILGQLEAIRVLCGCILGILVGRLVYDVVLSMFGMGVRRHRQ